VHDTLAIVGFLGSIERVWERIDGGEWEERVQDMVIWKEILGPVHVLGIALIVVDVVVLNTV
jgi:hypothetical protein